MAGYRVKRRAGNARAGREHRRAETRGQTAAPLLGNARAVGDPVLAVMIDGAPSPAAYPQERAWLPAVLARVQPGAGGIADRNFCPRGAGGLGREHAPRRFTPLAARRVVAAIESGRGPEPRGVIDAPDGSGTLAVRRIRLDLHPPTRAGANPVDLRTPLPAAAADACTGARLYRARGTLENAFLPLTRPRRCAIDPLAYPPAAGFGLAMAVVASHGRAVVKATLR